MERSYLNAITKYKFGWPLLVLLGGTTFGYLMILVISRFGLTYGIFCTAVIIFPFIAFMYGNTKRLLWTAIIFLLPITVDITLGHTGHIGGTAGYVISAYDIVLAALYLLWVTEIITNKDSITFFSKFSIPAFSLIGIALLSMTVAPFPNLSWYEIIEIIKMYLTFFYFANNIKTKSDFQYVTIILLAGLFLEGVLGFLQHRYSEPFFPSALGGPGWIESRVKGTWTSYNDFAWYLTYILPLAMSMIFANIRLIYKIMCFVTLSFGMGSLMWTNARSGWISCGIALLFVTLSTFSRRRGKLAVMNFFFSIIAIMILASPLYPRLGEKMYGRFAGNDRGSAESRLPQFEIAYNIILDHPLLGIGINNYTQIMYDYDSTAEGINSLTHHQVHNIFLQIAAEMGVFGLFTFLWLIYAIFKAGIDCIVSNTNFMSYVVIGFLGGIMAFLIHGLYDTESIGGKLFHFTWFFAGIIFAINKMNKDKPIFQL